METSDLYELRKEIISLILLCQEGSYWDFKKEWHGNKGDLLHDIICMANNISNRDAYIIIGIDEENDFCPFDISHDPNRKNTQKIVDFLKDKKFAGGIRPVVHVQELNYLNAVIDVVIVKNSRNTPFFLSEQFEKVRANNIYARIMDTNTPIDKSADINYIEYLWKKRFRLDETPLEKINYYLQSPSDWVDTGDEQEFKQFYTYCPEFTIRHDQDRSKTGYEFYLFGQVNHTPHWYTITLCYHQTALEQFQGIALDGGRCFVVAPAREYLSLRDAFNVDARYAYFVNGSLRCSLLFYFLSRESNQESYQYHTFIKSVLIFDSEDEKISFDNYVKQNQALYYKLCNEYDVSTLPSFPSLPGYNVDAFKDDYISSMVLKQMLVNFRNIEILKCIPQEDTF